MTNYPNDKANISFLNHERKLNPYVNQIVYQFNYETNRRIVLNVISVNSIILNIIGPKPKQ